MKEQLTEAWRTANKINLLFIEQIDDAGMKASLSVRGGRTVYEQLAHVHNVRMQWLEICAKEIYNKNDVLQKEVPCNKTVLLKAFERSANCIETVIDQSWEKAGKVTGFKKGLIPFVAYLLTHEAHHRGNILLTLKQTGAKIPEKLKWEIWDWGKL